MVYVRELKRITIKHPPETAAQYQTEEVTFLVSILGY